MKFNKHTFFSFLFLFIFLSAFSSGAYASLSSSLQQFSHFSKTKELKEDGSISTSENLVFEEAEDDGEETVAPFTFILPGIFNFSSLLSFNFNSFSSCIKAEKTVSPLFISIRVLRI